MKFTAQKEDILSIVEHADGVVEKRNTIPILSNVLLRAEKGSLTVIATDLDMIIQEKIDDVSIEVPGAETVNSSTFVALLRKMPAESQINIESANGFMHINSGRIKYKIPTLPEDDYPLSQPIEAPEIEIQIEDIERAFRKVKNSISSEATRYYLNGIYMTVEDDGLFAVSTDGHRLSIAKIADLNIENPNAIIPKKVVAEILKLLPLYEGTITFKINDRKFEISKDNLIISSKLIDGTFPDYRRVKPTNTDIKIRVKADVLAEAIERVSVISSEKTNCVKIEAKKDSMKVTVRSIEMGDAEEEVPCECNEEITIGYNSRYIKEILLGYSDKSVEIGMQNNTSPALIIDPENPEDLNVIMPMRV